MKILDIIHYPIKSMSGVHSSQTFAENRGLKDDRRFMIVDREGKFITQRKYPVLSQIDVGLSENNIVLRDKRNDQVIQSQLDFELEKRQVEVWRSKLTSHALIHKEIDQWVSDIIGEKVSLVYMDETDHRQMNPDFASEEELVSFADGYPILITNQRSLDALNEQLKEKVTMDRFRANIVVDGEEAWEENTWKRLRIGDAVLRVAKPCARCKVINIDQKSAEVGNEVLPALAKLSRQGDQVIFGINCIVENEGAISLKMTCAGNEISKNT